MSSFNIMNIDYSWTLFLDRDGVINKKLDNDYVKNWEEFVFIDGAQEAISMLSSIFGKIIVVTNQRGVGRGLMSENNLIEIHSRMIDEIKSFSGKIDKVYYCTDLSHDSDCRKPNTGMALRALSDFPEINFDKSVLIGDSDSDILFGNKLGMICVKIEDSEMSKSKNYITCRSLIEFANSIYNTPGFFNRLK